MIGIFRPEFEGRGVGKALDDVTRKLRSHAIGVGPGGMKTTLFRPVRPRSEPAP